MKTLFLYLVFILPLAASAQTNELKVSNVEVGTWYSTAISNLGKPNRIINEGKFPCDDGKMITTHYEGLVLKFIESNPEKKFFVASIELISPKWEVSGIKIGANLKDVKDKFSGKLRRENGFEILSGYIKDGYSNFYFRKRKLVKVTWELNVC